MDDTPDLSDRSSADAKLEQEIRKGRKFTLQEAIGRLAGPGAMKGESPVARLQQAEIEISTWLRSHLMDASGALETVLHRDVKESELLLNDFEHPLNALAKYCQGVLESEHMLQELVRSADIEFGRIMGERPHLDKPGVLSDPDDPYTSESVRETLTKLLAQLADRSA